MKPIVVSSWMVVLVFASTCLGQKPPDVSEAEQFLQEYGTRVVGATWTATVKAGDFIEGKWQPDGKEITVHRQHQWVGERKFIHVTDKVDGAITNVGVLGIDPDKGKLVGWHFGKDGMETWWVTKHDPDLWLFGSANTDEEWTVAVRFLGEDEVRIEPVKMVNGEMVPDESSWPSEVYRRSRAKGRTAASQLNQFKTPLAIYQLDMGEFPTTEQGLEALDAAPEDLKDPRKWNGPYMSRKVPNDPWGSRYRYERLPTQGCRISSAGPDGKWGTKDDISVQVEW